MLRSLILLCALMMTFGINTASAQLVMQEVDLGDGAAGRYRAPAAGRVSHIAFLAIHRTNDFRNHQIAIELANRGFGTLGIRTRFGTSEAAVNFELIALDIRNGVRYLKNVKGHSRVILVGRSGGGPSTSLYQAIAENGVSYCKGLNKITQCPFTGAEFTPADMADGIVFTDAHPSNGVNQVRSINPIVVDENQPFGPPLNLGLDPFNPLHGYNPAGNSVYAPAFIDAYSRAQSARLNRLIDSALSIKRQLDLGTIDPATAAFGWARSSARLPEASTNVHCCTVNPQRLLQDSTGTLSAPQIIHTARVPDPGIREDDNSERVNLTITSFLTAGAIRSNHSLDDIDWCSSNNSTVCAVRSISVPTLVMSHQGHYFIRDGEQIYEESASADKEYLVVEGMTHAGGNCTACASYWGTGPYMNTVRNLFNHVASWANARFDPAVAVRFVPSILDMRVTAGLVTVLLNVSGDTAGRWQISNVRAAGAPARLTSRAADGTAVAVFDRAGLAGLRAGVAVPLTLTGTLTNGSEVRTFTSTTAVRVVR